MATIPDKPLSGTTTVHRPIARPISQVTLTVGSHDQTDTLARVRESILRWAERKAGVRLPTSAWDGKTFELEDIGSQRAAAAAIESPTYWAARFDDADARVPQRSWVVEVGLGETATRKVLFGTRLACVTPSDDIPFERSVPGFVRNIISDFGASLEGREIGPDPWLVENDADVEELIMLIRSPTRRADVIVCSLPERATDINQASISVREVHRRTLGVSHVAVLVGAASYGLSDRVGSEFSAYRGTVRTYRPGFNPNEDEPFSHPWATAQRIANWQPNGSRSYERLLVSQGLIRSVAYADLEARVPPFATVRRIAAERQIEHERKSGASETDLLTLADQEIAQLSRSIDDQKVVYDGLLEQAEDERNKAVQEAEQTRVRAFGLRSRIEALEAALRNTSQADVPIPENLDGFEDWCSKNLSGSVELHNRAYQGIKSSEYEDVTLIYQALIMLRDYYVPMRRNGGSDLRVAFEGACQELGLSEEPTFSGVRWGEEGETYFIRYAGRRCLLERHLKNGNSREARFCFRLYFFWDEDSEQAIVGWLPSHLDTRLT